jgi:hypothetical protein
VELEAADQPEASQPSRVAAAGLQSGCHPNFLGRNDPTARKSEADAAVSLPFPVPTSGRTAAKLVNDLRDELMKVFRAE